MVSRPTRTSRDLKTKDQDELAASDEAKSVNALNRAVQGVSRMRRGLHKSSLTSQSRAGPQRSSARLGNRVASKNFSSEPDGFAISEDEPETSSPKRVKTRSNLAHKAEGLTNDGQPKATRGRGRPKKVAQKSRVETEDTVQSSIEEQDSPSSRDKSPTISGSGCSKDSVNSNDLDNSQELSVSDAPEVGFVSFVDLKVYKTMLNILKYQRATLKNNNNEQPKKHNKSCQDVDDLKDELSCIIKSYSALHIAGTNGRAEEMRNLRIELADSTEKITALVSRLKLKVEGVLTKVYLDIVPDFIKVIRMGVKAQAENELLSMDAIAEIANLLDTVYQLALKAVEQPSEVQPITTNGIYRLCGPTVKILPIISNVREAFVAEVSKVLEAQEAQEREIITTERERVELERKEVEEKRERRERGKMERELEKVQERERQRRWREQEKKEREQERWEMEREKEARKFSERRSELNDLHRRQRQTLDAKLVDPLLADLVQKEIARGEASSDNRRASDTMRLPRPLSVLDHDEPRQNHRRASSDRNERERASNKREEHCSGRLSYEEQVTFVDTLKSERGDDRYAKVAERLGRSMDFVFDCAKELQQAMDVEHENSDMNRPCDDWTYDIWVEQE